LAGGFRRQRSKLMARRGVARRSAAGLVQISLCLRYRNGIERLLVIVRISAELVRMTRNPCFNPRQRLGYSGSAVWTTAFVDWARR